MRLLADECVAGSTVAALRNAGFDVTWTAEDASGIDDGTVLARAFSEGRILLTEDKDFGEMTVRLGHETHGVVLFATSHLPADARARRAVAALNALGDGARGHFVVVEASRIRRRPLARRTG